MPLIHLLHYPSVNHFIYSLYSSQLSPPNTLRNYIAYSHSLSTLILIYLLTVTMAYSVTVAALLHPWSGRIDIASRLPLRRNESTISNTILFTVDRYPTTMENYKTRRKSLSVDIPWILRGQRNAAEYEVAEEEESTRLLFPSSRALLWLWNKANYPCLVLSQIHIVMY